MGGGLFVRPAEACPDLPDFKQYVDGSSGRKLRESFCV
jgi:hypothetical protein